MHSLRRSDLIGRYGGEEFLILLVATRLHEGAQIAEHLRRYLMSERFPETAAPITASFGVAEVCRGDTPEILIDKADKAMYKAKQDGRNCVVTDSVCAYPDNDGAAPFARHNLR